MGTEPPGTVKGRTGNLPHLLAIHAANPGLLPTQLANLLQLEHGITTNGKRIREVLDWHDQQAAA